MVQKTSLSKHLTSNKAAAAEKRWEGRKRRCLKETTPGFGAEIRSSNDFAAAEQGLTPQLLGALRTLPGVLAA